MTNYPDIRLYFLYSNQLSGIIPPELANLYNSNNPFIYLSDNNFSGCLPQELSAHCANIYLDPVIIVQNPNLSTENWDAFCNMNTGMCSCDSYLSLSNSIGSNLYEAAADIDANGSITGGQAVNMHAGRVIKLNAGFSVDQNADLSIGILTCN